jgi:hypothetical protein
MLFSDVKSLMNISPSDLKGVDNILSKIKNFLVKVNINDQFVKNCVFLFQKGYSISDQLYSDKIITGLAFCLPENTSEKDISDFRGLLKSTYLKSLSENNNYMSIQDWEAKSTVYQFYDIKMNQDKVLPEFYIGFSDKGMLLGIKEVI